LIFLISCRKRLSSGLSTDSTADSENPESNSAESVQKQFDEVFEELIGLKFMYLAKMIVNDAESEMMTTTLNQQLGLMDRTAFGLEDEFAVPQAANDTLDQERLIEVRELRAENQMLRERLLEGIAQVRHLHEEIQLTISDASAGQVRPVQGVLILQTPPAQTGRDEMSFFSHGPPKPPPPPDLAGDSQDLGLQEWLEVLRDDIVKRVSQDADTEARTSDLESAVVVLKAEHQHRTGALETQLAELTGALALLQENHKASAGAKVPTMGALHEGRDKMGKMKAILEKAEQHLKEKAGQYSERELPELFEAASNSLASSDGCKHSPVAVGLTVDGNFDHIHRSAASVSDFNRELQDIVSASLKVPAAAVQVLCHQRGSIKATVVLMGDDDDEEGKTPSELAQELINAVGTQGEGLRARSLLGSNVKKAEVFGSIALPICKAVQDAVATLSASGSSAQEVAAARKQDVAIAKRFNFMHADIVETVEKIQSAMDDLSSILYFKDTHKESVAPGSLETDEGKRVSGQAVELKTRSEHLEAMLAGSQEALKASVLLREQDLMKRTRDLEAEVESLQSQVQEFERRLRDPGTEAAAQALIVRMETAQDTMLAEIAALRDNEKRLDENLDTVVSSIEASSRSANIAMLQVTEKVLEVKGQTLRFDYLIGKQNADEADSEQSLLELKGKLAAVNYELEHYRHADAARTAQSKKLEDEFLASNFLMDKTAFLEQKLAKAERDVALLRSRGEKLEKNLAEAEETLAENVTLRENLETSLSRDEVLIVLYRQNEEKYERDLKDLRTSIAFLEQEKLEAHNTIMTLQESTASRLDHSAAVEREGHAKGLQMTNDTACQIRHLERQMQSLESCMALINPQVLRPQSYIVMDEVISALELSGREARMTMLKVKDQINELRAKALQGEAYYKMYLQQLSHKEHRVNPSPVGKISRLNLTRQASHELDDSGLTHQSEFAYMRAYSRLFSGHNSTRGGSVVECDMALTEQLPLDDTPCGQLEQMLTQIQEIAREIARDCQDTEAVLGKSLKDGDCFYFSDDMRDDIAPSELSRASRRAGGLKAKSDSLEKILEDAMIVLSQICRAQLSMDAQIIRQTTRYLASEKAMQDMASRSKTIEEEAATQMGYLEDTLSKIRGFYSFRSLQTRPDAIVVDTDGNIGPRIRALEEENTLLRARATRADSNANNFSAKMEEMQHELGALEDENKLLRARATREGSNANNFSAKMEELQPELGALKEGNNSPALSSNLEQEVELLRIRASQAESDEKQLASKVEEMQQELVALQMRSKDALAARDAQITELKEHLSRLDMELAAAPCPQAATTAAATMADNNLWGCEFDCGYRCTSYDDVVRHEMTCQHRESNAEDQIAQQSSAVSDLQSKMRELEVECGALKTANGTLEAHHASTNEELAQAKASLKELEERMQKSILDLSTDLSESQARSMRLEVECEELKGACSGMEIGVGSSRAAMAMLLSGRQDMSHRMDTMRRQAETLEQELVATQARVRDLEDENNLLKAQADTDFSELVRKVQELQRELDSTVEEAGRAADLTAKVQAQSDELDSRQETAREALSVAIVQMVDAQRSMRRQISVLEQERAEAEETLSGRQDMSHRMDTMRRQAETLEQELVATQARVRDLEDENNLLKAQADTDFSELVRKVQELQRELDSTVEEAGRAADLTDKVQAQSDELDSRQETVREALSVAIVQMVDAQRSMRRQISVLEQELAQAEEKLDLLRAEKDTNLWGCEFDCGYRCTSYDDVVRHEMTCQHRESNAEDQIAQQSSAVSDLQSKVSELEVECGALKTANGTLEAHHASTKEELAQAKASLKELEERMQTSILDLSTDLSESQARSMRLEVECEALKGACSGMEMGVGSSRAAMAMLLSGRQDMSHRMDTMRRKADTLEQELVATQARARDLEDENNLLKAQADTDFSELVRKVQELQRELDSTAEEAGRAADLSAKVQAQSDELDSRQEPAREALSVAIVQMVDAQRSMRRQISVLEQERAEAEEKRAREQLPIAVELTMDCDFDEVNCDDRSRTLF
jgi:chromosome segregation ATPase